MRNVIFALVGLLPLVVLPCHARLGETLDQCIARYGKAVGTTNKDVPGELGDSYTAFQKNGFVIGVIIFRGTVGAESIFKIDKSEFSDTEKQALLDADSASLHWKKQEIMDFTGDVWLRDDNAVARYDTIGHSMTIESKEFYDASQAKKASDEKAKLKDF